MKMVTILWGLAALGVGLFFFFSKKEKTSSSESVSKPTSNAHQVYHGPLRPAGSIFSQLPEITNEVVPEKLFMEEEELKPAQSRLVAALNRPETTTQDDVRLIKKVFSHYRSVFKENPVGVHQEIVALLAGGNGQGIAYIPKNHPAVVNGKLHDRWGTPFYFHQISRDIIEVRSAGPDGKHWNDDDVFVQ